MAPLAASVGRGGRRVQLWNLSTGDVTLIHDFPEEVGVFPGEWCTLFFLHFFFLIVWNSIPFYSCPCVTIFSKVLVSADDGCVSH